MKESFGNSILEMASDVSGYDNDNGSLESIARLTSFCEGGECQMASNTVTEVYQKVLSDCESIITTITLTRNFVYDCKIGGGITAKNIGLCMSAKAVQDSPIVNPGTSQIDIVGTITTTLLSKDMVKTKVETALLSVEKGEVKHSSYDIKEIIGSCVNRALESAIVNHD